MRLLMEWEIHHKEQVQIHGSNIVKAVNQLELFNMLCVGTL